MQNPVNLLTITSTEFDTDEGPPQQRRHATVSRAQSVNHKAVTQMGCASPMPSTNMTTEWLLRADNAKGTAESTQRQHRSLLQLQNSSQVGSKPSAHQQPQEALKLQAMADWPRWLEEDVDSQAMLSAYQWYLHVSKKTMGPLPMIVHRSAFTEPPPAPTGTINILCTTESCERCLSGKGGYRFRWYSRHWIDRYKMMAREGAWGTTVTETAPLPPVPLTASEAPNVGVQVPDLSSLSDNRTSVSLAQNAQHSITDRLARGRWINHDSTETSAYPEIPTTSETEEDVQQWRLLPPTSESEVLAHTWLHLRHQIALNAIASQPARLDPSFCQAGVHRAVHTSVPVSLSENTAPPTQSNRHPEAEVQLPADHTPAEEEDKLPVLGRTGTEFLRK